MCGNVLRGRTDPNLPFFTERGSFWSNCTSELLATTTEAERQTRTRNRCNEEGYESVALVPLRASGETFGLLQFNDNERGVFGGSYRAVRAAWLQHCRGRSAAKAVEAVPKRGEAPLRAAEAGGGPRDRTPGQLGLERGDRRVVVVRRGLPDLGLEPQEFDATYEAFLASVHPEDREAVKGASIGLFGIREALRGGAPRGASGRLSGWSTSEGT